MVQRRGCLYRSLLGISLRPSQGRIVALTGSINPKAIAPECKDLAAGFLHNGLRQILRLADMFDEFHGDLLYKLECRLPACKASVKELAKGTLATSPSLCLLQTFKVVLSLQLRNEGIIGSKLSFSGEVLG